MDDVRTHDMRTEGDAPREVRVGDEVAGFVVDGELGVGGMGVVYSAASGDGRRVAIKVLRAELSHDPDSIARFLREAQLVRKVRHPNIVDVEAIGQLAGGQHYMVMELLVGETLRARLREGALPLAEATQVVDEIASALIAAHDQGVIHRDLKPDNVFLVENGVRLLDFGVAKLVRSGGTTPATLATQTGIALGTPWYMSPEQARGKNVDYRTDIYALGVLAYEVLTGVRPFHVLADGGTLAESAGSAPADLVSVIEAMISDDADARPTLAIVRAAIKRARRGLRGATSDEMQAVEREQRKRAASIGDQARTVIDASGPVPAETQPAAKVSVSWPSDVQTTQLAPEEIEALDDGATSRRTPVPMGTTIGVIAPGRGRMPSEPKPVPQPIPQPQPQPIPIPQPTPIPQPKPEPQPVPRPPSVSDTPIEAPPMPRTTPLPIELQPRTPPGVDTARIPRQPPPTRIWLVLLVAAIVVVSALVALRAFR